MPDRDDKPIRALVQNISDTHTGSVRMKKRFNHRSPAVIAAVSCATLLSACGGSDLDESTTATPAGGAATEQATTTTATAKANKAALSCADIPASLVNSVLGTTVEDPTSIPRENGGIQCNFDPQGKEYIVIMTLDNASTAARFEADRTNAEFLAGKSTPVTGLGDEAFFTSIATLPGEPAITRLHAREGNRAVSVISRATVEQSTALLKQLLAK